MQNKIKDIAKLVLFLLWLDPKQKAQTRWSLGLLGGVLVGLLSAPFDNVPFLYNQTKTCQIQLRLIGVISSLAIFSFVILYFYLKQSKKYKNVTRLTEEELNNYLKFN